MKLVLYGEPPSKKNTQEFVRFRRKDGTSGSALIQNERYRQFESDCGWQIPNSVRQFIDYPVNIKAIYYRSNLIKVDRPNLENALLDILVKWGVLADDNRDIAAASDGSRVLYDPDNPRIEVEITPLEDENYPIFNQMTRKRKVRKHADKLL